MIHNQFRKDLPSQTASTAYPKHNGETPGCSLKNKESAKSSCNKNFLYTTTKTLFNKGWRNQSYMFIAVGPMSCLAAKVKSSTQNSGATAVFNTSATKVNTSQTGVTSIKYELELRGFAVHRSPYHLVVFTSMV